MNKHDFYRSSVIAMGKELPKLAAPVSEATSAVWTDDKTAPAMRTGYSLSQILRTTVGSRIRMAGLMFLALHAVASGASISFDIDPFEGTTVRDIPGRQVVGGELFIAFHTATEAFVFDGSVFGVGNQIHFANGLINAVPSTGVNVVVLQTTDNDANPLTPFGAGNAADLLASQITDSGPGFFIYFNSNLNLARLVYSTDLGDNTADLKILARMLNLTGQAGIDALPTFSASNFAIADPSAVPEPSGFLMMSGGIAALFAFSATRRRFRVWHDMHN